MSCSNPFHLVTEMPRAEREEPYAVGCERTPFPLGKLAQIWPHLIQPVGRVHFAGAAFDNLPWGQDAATRSARRVANAIDAA